MHMPDEKCDVVNESVLLPSFSLDASNSISTFSVRICNRTAGKLNKLFEENAGPNLLLKVPSRSSFLPPTLPPYYYTSTFPSFFATLNPNHVKKIKESNKEQLMQFGHCKSDETDVTKTIVSCVSSQNNILQENSDYKEVSILAVQTKPEKVRRPNSPSEENALQKADKKLLKGEKKNIIPLATSDGNRNQSMSLSSPKCFTRDEIFLKRRRQNPVTHISISPNLRRKQRAATSMAPNTKTQFCPIVRPNTCGTYSFHDRSGPLTSRSEKQLKSSLKKGENKKISKKDLNTCFERYYSAQLQANKAKINEKKIYQGCFLPKQTHWNHSNENKTYQRRVDCANRNNSKMKANSVEKLRSLYKLKDLKIVSECDKSSIFNGSEEKKNDYETPKFEALPKYDKQLSPLLNKTTQTSTTTISRLSDKSEIGNNKSGKRFHYYTPTPLLSPEQIIIRDSVEKVRRWIETLPNHFDAIQQVSLPTQQDY